MAVVQSLFRPDTGSNAGAVYLFLNEEYWGITEMAVLTGVFGNPQVADMTTITGPFGPVISAGSFLLRIPGSAGIYLMCAGNNTAYPIVSIEALQYYQFGGTIYPTSTEDQVVAQWVLNLAQIGFTIDMPT